MVTRVSTISDCGAMLRICRSRCGSLATNGSWMRAQLQTPNQATNWMFVPLVSAPFSAPSRYRGSRWDIEPGPELEKVRKFLLVDGRAISFSESLTGYFASQRQGTIVGEPTAGANGDVVVVQL